MFLGGVGEPKNPTTYKTQDNSPSNLNGTYSDVYFVRHACKIFHNYLYCTDKSSLLDLF